MKHNLMVGPKLLPTDAMIFKGSKYLCDLVGLEINEYIEINDNKIEDINPRLYPESIIILGTPWLWDKCYESPKWKNLLDLFERYPNTKRLFLGIGSCFPLGKTDEMRHTLYAKYDELKMMFKGATIIARDCNTSDLLHEFGAEALPCPAYYALAGPYNPEGRGAVMIWHDPRYGISKVDYGPESPLLGAYIQRFQDEYADTIPQVYCITQEEADSARFYGLGRPQIIRDSAQVGPILHNASRVFSGRVHLAVPAYELGKDVELVIVDSRADVLYDVIGGQIMGPHSAVNKYASILRGFC